jgi:hypothetical protein
MANVLDGVQFRTLKAQLPSWRVDENYSDWMDCGDSTTFPSETEFRMAPVIKYVVTDSFDKVILTSGDKTAAMAKVSTMISEDRFATIRREEAATPGVAQYLSDRGVQFKLKNSDPWMSPAHFAGKNSDSVIWFRFRPDTYFQVQVKNGISLADLTFDDVDELTEYLDRQLRTSENDIHITRRAYGTSLYIR